MKHMDDDLFAKKEIDDDFNRKKDRFYEVFLCYFDETRGHLPLFTYPSDLKTDEDRLKIIKIHSIWFLDTKHEDLQHVDLEFGDKIYLAIKFTGKSWREKTRAGLTETTPETFVLMLAIPTDLSFIGADLLISLMSKVGDMADQLYILVKKEISDYKLIKSPKDETIIEEGKVIERELYKICKNLVPPVLLDSDVLNALARDEIRKTEKLAYLFYSELANKKLEGPREFEIPTPNVEVATEKGFFGKRVKISSLQMIDNNQKLRVAVQNISNDLHDVQVQIFEIKGFFETSSWQTEIETWFAGEELVFHYPVGEIKDIGFQLRIKSLQDGSLLISKLIDPKEFIVFERRPLLETTIIKDFMDDKPATISYSGKILDAIAIMNSKQLDYIIVTFDDMPMGIITNKDLLRKVLNRCVLRDNVDPKVINCKEIMTKPLITVNENDPIKTAALLSLQNQIKKIPVLRGNALVGIVTSNDLINVFLKLRVQSETKDEKSKDIANINNLPVKNIMNTKVVIIDFDDSCQKLLNTFLQKKIGSVLVQKNGKPVGIVTERNILKRVLEEGRNPREVNAGDLMSSPLISVMPDIKIKEAIEIMIHKGIKYLPVTDEKNPYLIKGIISNTDIFNLDISKTSGS